eukprot:c5517_g1_i1.p2 GENE.c5517_g1_i1~~c5517_g1_i1.p2  ORF type:complete len:186 (+),score=38.29 c5517_g1_i1:856-1413(+)
MFDVPSFDEVTCFQFDEAINHSSPSPDGRMLCVVGDMSPAFIIDCRIGKRVLTLHGHTDYSFSSTWHPNGLHVATGNQDKTCRVWDLRSPKHSHSVIRGEMASIRSLRYNHDGTLLTLSEAADFVHIVDVQNNYSNKQVIDVFGEIAGFAMSPDSENLFLAISDGNFGSLMEFHRHHHSIRYVDY